MAKPKVAFVELMSDNNMFKYFKLPNIGVVYLATILRNHGYKTRVFSEQYQKLFDSRTKQIKKSLLGYDIIGFSATTSSVSKTYEMAKQIKKIKPSIKVMIGGSHATFLPEEALKCCDHVITGEAEPIILDIVQGKLTDKIIRGRPVEELDKLPIPDFSLVENMRRYLRIYPIPISTSRGCPFACNFCSVTNMFGRRYRFRSADSILKEVKHQYKKYKKRTFFFYDDNFAANKPRIKDFLRKVQKSKLKLRWAGQARVDVAKDNELMDLMKKTNCWFVLIGFESINQKALDSINKKQDLQQIKDCIKEFNKRNIGIHGAFIFGCEGDHKSSFKETLDFCRENEIYSTQFTVLTPLPGSALFSELDSKNKLISKEWSLYDTNHVLFQPKNFSMIELQERLLNIWKKFYSFKDGIRYESDRIFKFRKGFNIKRAFKRFVIIAALKLTLASYIKHNQWYYRFLRKLSRKRQF